MVKTIYVDLGNSNLKYFADERYQGACAVGDMCSQFPERALRAERIVFASVASATIRDQFVEMLRARGFSGALQELNTDSTVSEFKSEYDIQQLGVDRYLNLLGSHSITTRDRVVVAAGTFVTLDLVVANRHLGGVILPNDQYLTEILKKEHFYRAPRAKTTSAAGRHLGNDTASAIASGAQLSVKGAIKVFLQEASRECSPTLIITGGGAKALLKYLPGFREIPNLQFIGMKMLDKELQSACEGSRMAPNVLA